MKAVIKDFGFEQLPTRTELDDRIDEHMKGIARKWGVSKAYKNFGKQRLERWMFVACDKKGNPLKEYRDPRCRDCADNDGFCPTTGLECGKRSLKAEEYQAALDRVIFENEILCCGKRFYIDTYYELIPAHNKTIEDYINSGGKLTLK